MVGAGCPFRHGKPWRRSRRKKSSTSMMPSPSRVESTAVKRTRRDLREQVAWSQRTPTCRPLRGRRPGVFPPRDHGFVHHSRPLRRLMLPEATHEPAAFRQASISLTVARRVAVDLLSPVAGVRLWRSEGLGATVDEDRDPGGAKYRVGGACRAAALPRPGGEVPRSAREDGALARVR